MLSHYLKVFFHNLLRQKAITLINIGGLAIGMAVFILVSLYVTEEFSHEQRWDKADRIARTVSTLKFNAESSLELGSGSTRALDALKTFFPDEIATGSRVFTAGQSVVVDQEVVLGDVNFVDPQFLDVFNFEEVQGSLAATLATPGYVALEEARARELFAGQALGRSLVLRLDDGSERDLTVSAVYRLPEGKGGLELSSLSLLVGDLFPDFAGTEGDWMSGADVETWVLLREANDVTAINARTDAFVEQYVRVPWMFSEDLPVTDFFALRLQPVRDIHFNPLLGEEGGSRLAAIGFAVVAALVLLIAVTNFAILSIARGAERIREVGVRKASGALYRQLQGQFLVEALCQAIVAFLIALALQELISPVFESMIQTELVTQMFSLPYLFQAVLLIAVVTLLGGLYPAFVLAASNPQNALKAGGNTSMGNTVLRRALVSFQFTIAVGLVVAILVIYRQMTFVQTRDAGFVAEQVVSVALNPESARNRGAALAIEIDRLEGVSLVTPASRAANRLTGSIQMTSLTRERGSNVSVELHTYGVGYDFFSLYSMPVLAGRSFSRERDPLLDSRTWDAEANGPFVTKVLVNESAVRSYGFASPEEAIGAQLYAPFRTADGEPAFAQHEIIGVVADSQFDNLRAAPRGEMFRLSGASNLLLSFRVEAASMHNITEALQSVWNEVVGVGSPLVMFGSDIVAEQFGQEEKEGRLLAGFALLAMLVSCMGLYGLVAFDAGRRTKEIGVRKVLGGNHGSIQALFLRQYFWAMLVANLVAWPLTLWAMQYWLERFPYQIEPWLFLPICLIASLLVLVIAGSTLVLTVLKASRVKPALLLRYE